MTSTQLAPGVLAAWLLVTDQPEAADRLLAAEVAGSLGCREVDVRLGRSCQHCGSSVHGRPVVLSHAGGRAPKVSLSRAPGVVLVAVSRERPVGVDIEQVGAAGATGPSEVLLHADECAQGAEERTKTWVRKESLLKATGDGLRVDPTLVRLSDPDDDPRLVDWVGRGTVPASWMTDLEVDGYTACVTVLGDEADVTRLPAASAVAARRATP